MRKVGCLIGLVFLVSLTAAAQNAQKAEVFLGYSYVRARPSTSGASGINFHGGSGSLAYNATSSLGIVADFGGYRAGNIQGSGVDANVFTYLFGPRLSYRAYDRVTPFAQVLFGGARGSASFLGSSTSQNSFAMAAGGGLDVGVTRRVAARLVQVEYLLTRFQESTSGRQTQNNLCEWRGGARHCSRAM